MYKISDSNFMHSPDFDISEASGPNDLKAIVGSSVSVSCTIPASFPPAEVGMFQVTNLKGKVQLENSSRYKVIDFKI